MYEALITLERHWEEALYAVLLLAGVVFIGNRHRSLILPLGAVLLLLLAVRGGHYHTFHVITKLGTEDELLAIETYNYHLATYEFDTLENCYEIARNANERCWVGIAMCGKDFDKAKAFFKGGRVGAPFCRIGDSVLTELVERSGNSFELSGEEFCEIAHRISKIVAKAK